MSVKRSMNYLNSEKCQIATRLIKRGKWKRKSSYEKNKLITKIQNLFKTEETNKIEKQIEWIEKSNDDSSRKFKAIKDLNEMKPHLLKKEINIQQIKKLN